MLYLAWTISNEKSLKWELEAFRGLAQTNFYFGQLHKSDFYNDRYLRGKAENDTSIIKQVAVGYVLSKRK